MARLNPLIETFERGEVAFGQLLPVGDLHLARRMGESDLDLIVLDFEHEGFDFPMLGHTLQWLLSRRRMLHEGSALVAPTPLVRLPFNTAERCDWLTKQTLDYGPFGLVSPHLSTPDDARWLVSAARYPQQPDAKIPDPQGHRGFWPGLAWRYWGCNEWEDYYHQSDVWPLDPDGNLVLIPIVEEMEAWENIEEIVQVPGIAGIWFGPGDGSVSIGNLARDWDHPVLARYRDRVLEACRNAGVIAATSSHDIAQTKRLVDQGFQLILSSNVAPEQFAAEGRRLVGREPSTWAKQRLADLPDLR